MEEWGLELLFISLFPFPNFSFCEVHPLFHRSKYSIIPVQNQMESGRGGIPPRSLIYAVAIGQPPLHTTGHSQKLH